MQLDVHLDVRYLQSDSPWLRKLLHPLSKLHYLLLHYRTFDVVAVVVVDETDLYEFAVVVAVVSTARPFSEHFLASFSDSQHLPALEAVEQVPHLRLKEVEGLL